MIPMTFEIYVMFMNSIDNAVEPKWFRAKPWNFSRQSFMYH